MLIIAGAAALVAAGAFVAVTTLGGGDPAGVDLAQAGPGLPPPPQQAATETTPEVAKAIAAARAGAAVRRRVKADPSSIPPASAGSNGSYTPPPPGKRDRIAARIHAPDGNTDESSILLGGTAIPPPGAPEQVQDFVSAANSIVGYPYKWGGGHASFRDNGYDCSGAVSYALAGAGLLGAPAASGQMMSWGVPGPGRWLTIYAKPSHVYAVVGGLRWDTVGDAKGSGPRWHPFDAYPSGFAIRHLPTL